MAEITAAIVKQLRDKTNAGMMDCKKALAECNGDLEEAVKYLREKGIAKAASKADRVANQGIITSRLTECGCDGIMLEVNCETDFVSKNDNFRAFVDKLADTLIDSKATTLEEALTVQIDGSSVDDYIKAKVIELGENMMLRRFVRLSVADKGAITDYIHMGGKVGVLLSVSTGKQETTKTDAFKTLIKDITLHIAASAPRSLTSADLDPAIVAEEKEIYRAQLIEQGKPESLLEKILPGKMKAFYAQACLLDQGFVKDPAQTVSALIAETAKTLGDDIQIVAFSRYQLGA